MSNEQQTQQTAIAFAEWLGSKGVYEYDGDKWYDNSGDCYYETRSLYREFQQQNVKSDSGNNEKSDV